MDRIDPVYIEANARRMHPDLYADVEPSPEVAALIKRYDLADARNEVTEFYLHRSTDMQWAISEYMNVTVSNYVEVPNPEYDPDSPAVYGNYTTKSERQIDTEATRIALAKHVQVARKLGYKVEKEYTDDHFTIIIKTPHSATIRIVADRKSMCEKKVVGQEWVPPSTVTTDGHYKDITEWDCEPVALTKIEVEV